MKQLNLIAGPAARTAGVDEAGRGPLAGPVIAAAVILDPAADIPGLRDSKRLSAGQRESLAKTIRRCAAAWALGRAECYEIDELNVLQATLLAMKRAIEGLVLKPDRVLVDGRQAPPVDCAIECIIRGDATVAAISAASILAKVSRDAEMLELDKIYPGYGFAQHKGYPTRLHLSRLREMGVCKIHRRSYAPVRQFL